MVNFHGPDGVKSSVAGSQTNKSGTAYSLNIPAPETQDNTIHWHNAGVMLGHCLRRLANIILIKTLQALITIFNREGIFYLNTS